MLKVKLRKTCELKYLMMWHKTASIHFHLRDFVNLNRSLVDCLHFIHVLASRCSALNTTWRQSERSKAANWEIYDSSWTICNESTIGVNERLRRSWMSSDKWNRNWKFRLECTSYFSQSRSYRRHNLQYIRGSFFESGYGFHPSSSWATPAIQKTRRRNETSVIGSEVPERHQ